MLREQQDLHQSDWGEGSHLRRMSMRPERPRPRSPPPMEWYYCSVHRVSHCISRVVADCSRSVPTLLTPPFGECAWLFFHGGEAILHVQHDVVDHYEAPFTLCVRRGGRGPYTYTESISDFELESSYEPISDLDLSSNYGPNISYEPNSSDEPSSVEPSSVNGPSTGTDDSTEDEDCDVEMVSLLNALTLSDDTTPSQRAAISGAAADCRGRTQSTPVDFAPPPFTQDVVRPMSPMDECPDTPIIMTNGTENSDPDLSPTTTAKGSVSTDSAISATTVRHKREDDSGYNTGYEDSHEAKHDDARHEAANGTELYVNGDTSATIVHVPIRRSQLVDTGDADEVSAIMGALVPQGAKQSVMQSIRRAGPSRGSAGRGVHIEFFAYTDVFGAKAAQPTAHDIASIRRYFQPLNKFEEGKCSSSPEGEQTPTLMIDPVLRRAREWSCWAQGFAALPNEVRWALALVFDFANIMIVRQAQEIHAAEEAGVERAEQEEAGEAKETSQQSDSDAADRYENFVRETRERLDSLLFAVEHVADVFGVKEVIEVPDLDSPESRPMWAAVFGGDDVDDVYRGLGGPRTESDTDEDSEDDFYTCLSDFSE